MMIDNLDLAFEDPEERGRHRRRSASSQKKRKKKKRRGRSGLALLMTIVLLGGLGIGAYAVYDKVSQFLTTPDYAGDGTGEAVVEIKPGAIGVDMAKALKAADVIKSEQAFIDAWAVNPDAQTIQPGTYRLRQQMSAAAAILALLDPANRIVQGVLIREGLVTVEIYEILAEELELPLEDFIEAAKDPVALGVPEWWFTRQDKVESPRSIEGFLFPARYEFPPDITAEQALKTMVQKFLDVTGKLDFANRVQTERNISPYEALIAASIVEAEVQTPEDMGKAARAVYNRVYTDKLGHHKLQLDAAINYFFKITGAGARDPNEFKQSELNNPDNPYNTHLREGFPISPIGSPGENALKAAMEPPAGDWLFWITVDKKGTTLFAETWAGHCDNGKIAVENGVLSQPC